MLKKLRIAVALLGLVWVASGSWAIDVLKTNPTVQSDQVRAELLVHAPRGLSAGATILAGLQLQHAKDWHTYWKNPGDSGLPTHFEWHAPAGFEISDVAWPTPKKFSLGPLANFGYDGEVLLPVSVTLPKDWSGESLDIGLKASWLACRTECIPEEGAFRLKVSGNHPTSLYGAVFETSRMNEPKNIAIKLSSSSVEGKFFIISSDSLPSAWRGKTLTVFPEMGNIIEPGAPWEQTWSSAGWTARLPLASLRTESPAEMVIVVAQNEGLAHGQAAEAGARLTLPVGGTWPAASSMPEGVSPALAAALEKNATASPASSGTVNQSGFFAALLGALLGGFLLNLMPCVFPVLAIKVLAFTQHRDAKDFMEAAHVRAQHRASGLAYTAGVVLSFVALGGLLVALRSAGEQLGWGFQMQSPAVVAALATLFTLVGLNLAGLFEFGSVLPSSVASFQAKNPTTDSFLTGMLATAVASPCTAPFMGASLGLAVGLPTLQALSIFAVIGLGMAAPYLLASWVPAVARMLPRPGTWMITFKQFMAFPMFGTVVWLLWVLGQQSGINGAATLLALLVMLAMLLWSWTQIGALRAWLTSASALGLLSLVYAMGPIVVANDDTTDQAPATHPVDVLVAGTWQPWSAERMLELTHAGRTVFVDYTAAWCVTCQYNKLTAFSHPDVLAAFAEGNVALLRADWTRRDPAVTASLASLGRNGVPTYALHRPGQAPLLLSEVLSVGEIKRALAGP